MGPVVKAESVGKHKSSALAWTRNTRKDNGSKWPDHVMTHGPWLGFHLVFHMTEIRKKNNTV